MFVDGNSIEGQNKPLATRLWAQILLSLPILFMPSFSLAQAPLKWTSGSHHVALLEVYSSQGCSSCPPAQKWVNQFTESDLLWDQVIPMVFHVNYWDYIGWKDPFATEYFSQRQRALKSNNLIQSVYTPGFVVDGKEWKGWFQGRPVPRASPSA
jgi:hypothetical protein